jgi:peptidoglycan/LPS O-acetylase OafA/YrhL
MIEAFLALQERVLSLLFWSFCFISACLGISLDLEFSLTTAVKRFHFFFILSGVVLTYTYRDAISSRTIGWLDFFNLRLSRIIPVHFATWLIATVLQVWFALGEFIIGICIGLMILQQGRLLKSSRNANLLLCFCAVALVVLNRLPGLGPVAAGTRTYLLFVPVLALTLVALVSGPTFITPLLENRLAILLGEASYSLYLVHGFFTSSKINFASCLVGSIASSVILYWLLERPARRIWLKVLGSQRTTNAKPVAHSGTPVIGIGPDEPICIPPAKGIKSHA